VRRCQAVDKIKGAEKPTSPEKKSLDYGEVEAEDRTGDVT
jgi:hypothetical protein